MVFPCDISGRKNYNQAVNPTNSVCIFLMKSSYGNYKQYADFTWFNPESNTWANMCEDKHT